MATSRKIKAARRIGTYNPDWAIVFDKNGEERLYFVVESKGSVFENMLRDLEQAKIQCGKAHFEALDTDANYLVVNSVDNFIDKIT